MDDSGSLATPSSERNRVFDVLNIPVLQVNYPWGRVEETDMSYEGTRSITGPLLAFSEPALS
jgi:hypothetical protein